MLTGEVRNQIDRIWDAFWSGGISNPMEVIEQMTYLQFKRVLFLADRTALVNQAVSTKGWMACFPLLLQMKLSQSLG